MTCTAVRILCAPEVSITDPAKARELRLRDQLGKHLVLSSQDQPITAVPAGPEGPARFTALYRVSDTLSLTTIMAALAKEALYDRTWWRVSYHVCRHDTGGACESWQTLAEFGPLPVGV